MQLFRRCTVGKTCHCFEKTNTIIGCYFDTWIGLVSLRFPRLQDHICLLVQYIHIVYYI